MSQDQRPRPVKAVSVAAAPPADVEDGEEAEDVIAETDVADEPTAKGGVPVIGLALFLIGCGAGGAGLAALPHLAPELAARIFGHTP